MKKIIFSLVALLLASAAFSSANAADKSKLIVTEVVDGDTIKGVVGCKEYVTIRLADIDCADKE